MSDMRNLHRIFESLSFEDEAEFVGTYEPLLSHLGLRAVEREPYETYMWDGETFNSALPDRHVYHDIAHWLLASPERRSIPEYGLGRGPETSRSLPVDIEVLKHDGAVEETGAALLGVLLQHQMGIPCGLMAEELRIIENGGLPPADFIESMWGEVYQKLVEDKIITDDGMPVVIAEMRELGLFQGQASPKFG